MKIKKIKDLSTDASEKVDLQDSQNEITGHMGKMHLLIVAIDPAIPMGIKSVTLDFQNREEGLQAFNVLAAAVENVYKTYVEDTENVCKGQTVTA